MPLNAGDIFTLIGEKTSPDTAVVFKREDGLLYSIEEIVVEQNDDGSGSLTCFLKGEEV